jgi:hypothetical protein
MRQLGFLTWQSRVGSQSEARIHSWIHVSYFLSTSSVHARVESKVIYA